MKVVAWERNVPNEKGAGASGEVRYGIKQKASEKKNEETITVKAPLVYFGSIDKIWCHSVHTKINKSGTHM